MNDLKNMVLCIRSEAFGKEDLERVDYYPLTETGVEELLKENRGTYDDIQETENGYIIRPDRSGGDWDEITQEEYQIVPLLDGIELLEDELEVDIAKLVRRKETMRDDLISYAHNLMKASENNE